MKTAFKCVRKTKRLDIRPLSEKDHAVWVEAYSQMQAPQNKWDETNWEPRYLTLAAFKKTLKQQRLSAAADQNYALGVFRRDDGALVGQVGLNGVNRGVFQNAYVGYRIFNNYWGYGYAKEALKATLDIGFKDLNLHRIEAGIEPQNLQSVAVAKANKMHFEGLSPKRLFFKDKWIDLLIYAKTCEMQKIKYRFK